MTILVVAGTAGSPGSRAAAIGRAADAAGQLGIRHEVLVADGSYDSGLLRESVGETGVRRVQVRAPGGGAALKAGVDLSAGAFILALDASVVLTPGLAARLWEQRSATGVLAGVPTAGRRVGTSGAWRRLLHRVVRVVVRRGLSLPRVDPGVGFILCRRDALERLRVESQGPSFLIEALVQLNADGWEIVELPETWPEGADDSGASRLLATGLDLLRSFPRLWRMRNSPFSADYDDRAFDSLIPLQRYWQRTRHARVTELLGDRSRVLDVGCGSSRIILGLPHAVGVDIQMKKLRRVQQASRRLVRATLTALPFRDGAFDAVICSQVIEHVAPSEVDWAEFARVLAPGGIFIVGTPDYATLTWRLLEWAYLRVHPHGYATEHVNRYTRDRLRRELGQAGFEMTGEAWVGGGELIVRAARGPSRTGPNAE